MQEPEECGGKTSQNSLAGLPGASSCYRSGTTALYAGTNALLTRQTGRGTKIRYHNLTQNSFRGIRNRLLENIR